MFVLFLDSELPPKLTMFLKRFHKKWILLQAEDNVEREKKCSIVNIIKNCFWEFLYKIVNSISGQKWQYNAMQEIVYDYKTYGHRKFIKV